MQLRSVLRQPPVAHLHMPELAFDDPQRVFHLGAYSGFDVFKFVQEGTHWTVLVQCTVLAWAHGHVPIDIDAFDLFSLGYTLVARICGAGEGWA